MICSMPIINVRYSYQDIGTFFSPLIMLTFVDKIQRSPNPERKKKKTRPHRHTHLPDRQYTGSHNTHTVAEALC